MMRKEMMKTFEFTEEQIKMLAKCIEHRQDNRRYINQVLREARKNEILSDELIAKYNTNHEEILRLQTLLNYINS